LSPDQQAKVAERFSKANLGAKKSAEFCRQLREKRLGKKFWTDAMKEKRRSDIAAGIGVPPQGNRGNKKYRASDDTIAKSKASQAKARERVAAERPDYITDQGMKGMLEKLEGHYTADVRKLHGEKSRAGRERRIAAEGPKTYKWYHDPSSGARQYLADGESAPVGWVRGIGKRTKVDHDLVMALSAEGMTKAAIAREVGCSVSRVREIRRTTKKDAARAA
jgi:hypothetical protein